MVDRPSDLIRRLHRAFNERDADTLRGCLAPDACWHVAGTSPMAGSFRGREQAWAEHFEPLWPSPARVEDRELLEHGEHVIAVGDAVHNFGDGEQRFETVEVFRLADGLVAERWEFVSGQQALDRLLARGCAAALEQDAG